MEILDFFQPVSRKDLFPEGFGEEEAAWYHALTLYEGEAAALNEKQIALIGIETEEDRSGNEIRRFLYRLKKAEYAEKVVDLGNLKFHEQSKDYETLGFILSELLNQNLIPVILNGKQTLTFAQYLAFKYLKNYVSVVSFDARLDFDLKSNHVLSNGNYLQKILLDEPSYLFGYTNIGYQSHFADNTIIEFLDKLFFDLHRLGDVRAAMADFEPVLRNAHLCSWDLSAIRQSDAPGTLGAAPNGFYAEEACLLSRYAGLSNNMRCAGFFNFNPSKDRDGQTAHLCAQMIWYFVDGVINRYNESPLENKDDFLKFITNMQHNAYQIVFYKSKRTDRWWMEVPIGDQKYSGSTHIIPCSYNDYLAACREEVPERWLQTVKKLS